MREVLFVYASALAFRIVVKIWGRLSLKGELAASTSALLLAAAAVTVGYAAFPF
jgi:hypothetical protein